MEDTCCHLDKVCGVATCGLFGVFDGHGGKDVSEYCGNNFPAEVEKELSKNPTNVYQMFDNVFKNIDREMEK